MHPWTDDTTPVIHDDDTKNVLVGPVHGDALADFVANAHDECLSAPSVCHRIDYHFQLKVHLLRESKDWWTLFGLDLARWTHNGRSRDDHGGRSAMVANGQMQPTRRLMGPLFSTAPVGL